MSRIRSALTCCCLLALTATILPAQVLHLPTGYVDLYSSVTDLNNSGNIAVPSSCTAFTYVESQTAAAASRSCAFDAPVHRSGFPSFTPGNFITTESASFVQGGDLHARASVRGTLAPRVEVGSNDAIASFSDAMTIEGPFIPAKVVFTLAIHGTYTGLAGPVGAGIKGRLDMQVYRFDASGTAVGGFGVGSVNGLGDGATQTADLVVDWRSAFGNTLGYKLSLIAFGRTYNTGTSPLFVDIDSDYSHTARIQSYAIFDATGKDITSFEKVSFASRPAVTATPEPASVVLLASGLVCLAAVGRRRLFAFGVSAKTGHARLRL